MCYVVPLENNTNAETKAPPRGEAVIDQFLMAGLSAKKTM